MYRLTIYQAPTINTVAAEVDDLLVSQHIQPKCIRQVIDNRENARQLKTSVIFFYFHKKEKLEHKKDVSSNLVN